VRERLGLLDRIQSCRKRTEQQQSGMNFSVEDDLWWSAPLKLTSWAGYQSRYGPYGAMDSPTPSDGRVKLVFAPEARGLEPLSQSELAQISWFETHEPAVSAAVRQALLAWCAPGNPARPQEVGDHFPTIGTEDDLRRQIGLHTIFVHQIDGGGTPYIGYEFGCEWDIENDLGVLMHGTRPVEIGFAETAFMLWIAEKDWKTQAPKPATAWKTGRVQWSVGWRSRPTSA
jgi:hypothetical protein